MHPVDEYSACDKAFTARIFFGSITSEFELYCGKGHVKQFVQTVTLFVASVLSSGFILLQDRFGARSVMMALFFSMALPGVLCTHVLGGLASKVAGLTALWTFNESMTCITPVYFNELLVEPYRNASNVVVRFSHCLGASLGTLLTFYLRDYRLIISVYFAGYVAFFGVLIFAFPDSPSFLLKQGKRAALRKTVARIASVNSFPEQKLLGVLDRLDNILYSKRPHTRDDNRRG